MPFQVDDPIRWSARDNAYTKEEFLKATTRWFEQNGNPRGQFTLDYLESIYNYCRAAGISPLFAVAQMSEETNKGTSPIWKAKGNPAGIAVEDDNDHSIKYLSGDEAAAAQVIHLYTYVHGRIPAVKALSALTNLDPNYEKVLALPWAGTIRTVSQLSGRWASDQHYAGKIAEHANAIFPALPNAGGDPEPQEEPMAGGCIALISAGHRNKSGGDPAESARTPRFAQAYLTALKGAGHIAHYINSEDVDGIENFTNGTLDLVGREVVDFANRYPDQRNLIMLDLHIEGGGPSGVFSIVPNGVGLSTGASTGGHQLDSWDSNIKDRNTAHAISAGISETTGLPQRMCREKGVMDEHETGVGGQGFRLGMFAWTTPIKQRAVRLVVEHGDLQRDIAIIDQPDFAQKAAQGALKGIEQIFGHPTSTTPPVEPPADGVVYPAGINFNVASLAWGREVRGRYYSEEGTVSSIWLTERDYSMLHDHKSYPDGAEYFFFTSGLIIGRLNRNEKFRQII